MKNIPGTVYESSIGNIGSNFDVIQLAFCDNTTLDDFVEAWNTQNGKSIDLASLFSEPNLVTRYIYDVNYYEWSLDKLENNHIFVNPGNF